MGLVWTVDILEIWKQATALSNLLGPAILAHAVGTMITGVNLFLLLYLIQYVFRFLGIPRLTLGNQTTGR